MRPLLFVPAALLLLASLVLLILWPTPQSERVGAASSGTLAEAPRVLKMGYNMPEPSAMHLAALRFAEQLEQQSGGRIKVELHPNQELGNDHQMLEMARQGTLDLVLIPTAKLSTAIPEMQYPDLPFYFPQKEDLYAMLDGEPGRRLLERMRRIGLVGITFWGNGFKQFTANHPLLAPADFKGYKFRIMKSRLLQEQFHLLEAEAIPIDFYQVRAALKDGAVDGQENPLVAIHQMGIHQVQSDLTLSHHGYLAYAFAVGEKSLATLPSDLQSLLLKLARGQTRWQREENERQEGEYLRQIKAAGVHVHELSDQQRELFRHRLRPLADRFESIIGPDLLAMTDEYMLERYPGSVQHVLGVDVDLSGGSADVGREVRRGAALALADLGAQGEGFALLARDNLGQPSRALSNIERFGQDARVIGVVGGTHSSTLSAQLPRLQPLQLPFITPFAAESVFYRAPISPWLFSVATSNQALATFIADQVVQQGIQRVAVVVEDNRWGEDFSTLLGEAFAERQRTQVGRMLINTGTNDPSAERLRALATQAELLVLGLRTREGRAVLKTLASAGVAVKLLSVWGMPNDGALPMQYVESRRNAAQMKRLTADYRRRYGEEPRLLSLLAQAYDSASLLAQASLLAAPGAPQGRLQIRDRLENMPPWTGAVRQYAPAFTPTRHAAFDQRDYRLISNQARMDTRSRVDE